MLMLQQTVGARRPRYGPAYCLCVAAFTLLAAGATVLGRNASGP